MEGGECPWVLSLQAVSVGFIENFSSLLDVQADFLILDQGACVGRKSDRILDDLMFSDYFKRADIRGKNDEDFWDEI